MLLGVLFQPGHRQRRPVLHLAPQRGRNDRAHGEGDVLHSRRGERGPDGRSDLIELVLEEEEEPGTALVAERDRTPRRLDVAPRWCHPKYVAMADALAAIHGQPAELVGASDLCLDPSRHE